MSRMTFVSQRISCTLPVPRVCRCRFGAREPFRRTEVHHILKPLLHLGDGHALMVDRRAALKRHADLLVRPTRLSRYATGVLIAFSASALDVPEICFIDADVRHRCTSHGARIGIDEATMGQTP